MYSSFLNIPTNSNYTPDDFELLCPVQRDCMNNTIYERNQLYTKPVITHNINKPLNTNKNHIQQINNNRLKTIPYKNGCKLINRKKELDIISGVTTNEKKSLNVLSESSVDNTLPLIPEMISNFHSHNNIYKFSQAGIISRNLKPNSEYTKKCLKNIKNINKHIKNELL